MTVDELKNFLDHCNGDDEIFVVDNKVCHPAVPKLIPWGGDYRIMFIRSNAKPEDINR